MEGRVFKCKPAAASTLSKGTTPEWPTAAGSDTAVTFGHYPDVGIVLVSRSLSPDWTNNAPRDVIAIC